MIGDFTALSAGAPAGFARRLLDAGMDIEKAFRAHSPLSTDATKLIDTTVVHEFQNRLMVTRRLLENGQVMRLPNPFAWSNISHHTEDDDSGAVVDRNPLAKGENTLPDRAEVLTPVYYTFDTFQLTLPELLASRNPRQDVPLDVNLIRKKARNVAESIEECVVKGTFGGAALPKIGTASAKGLCNAPNLQTVSLSSSQAWNHASKTIAGILTDIKAIIVKFDNIKAWGPIDLFIPTSWMTALRFLTNTSTDRTAIEIIRNSLSGGSRDVYISDADTLPTDTAVAYLRDAMAVDVILGDFGGMGAAEDPHAPDSNPVPITVIPWEERGGLLLNWLIIACVIPRPKNTFSSNCAIVKLS